MESSVEIRVLTTPQELFEAAAQTFVGLTHEAVAERGCFSVALSGGSTPKSLFSLLAAKSRNSLPWDRMFFFWSDERHVPPTDPDSNYRMANEALLSRVPVPEENVFRVPAESSDAAAAASGYEQTIRRFFQEATEVPSFDLILLGMGPDGHTASLFPGTVALREKSRLVVANWVEKLKTERLSFTFPLLNAAHNVLFLVSGVDKAAMLKTVLEEDVPGEQYPAKLVRPTAGTLTWMLDRAAASALKSPKLD